MKDMNEVRARLGRGAAGVDIEMLDWIGDMTYRSWLTRHEPLVCLCKLGADGEGGGGVPPARTGQPLSRARRDEEELCDEHEMRSKHCASRKRRRRGRARAPWGSLQADGADGADGGRGIVAGKEGPGRQRDEQETPVGARNAIGGGVDAGARV